RLRLWIAAKEADDADLFVGVEKLSPTGALIGFSGYQGVPNDVAAKGWLRVSHREADEARSTETQPLHPYRRLLKVPGRAERCRGQGLAAGVASRSGRSTLD